jgi:hypothetical protein
MSKVAMSRFLFLGIALFALSGCSDDSSSGDDGSGGTGGSSGSGTGGSGGGGGSNLPDPCTLLSYADVESITGRPIASTEANEGSVTGDPSCIWHATDTFSVFQVALWSSVASYDRSAGMSDALPVPGIGDDAHLASSSRVYVKLGAMAFFTQSMYPVADGQISTEIQAATTGTDLTADDIAEYEAAFRGAKLVEPKL